jgi:hypothetical protein
VGPSRSEHAIAGHSTPWTAIRCPVCPAPRGTASTGMTTSCRGLLRKPFPNSLRIDSRGGNAACCALISDGSSGAPTRPTWIPAYFLLYETVSWGVRSRMTGPPIVSIDFSEDSSPWVSIPLWLDSPSKPLRGISRVSCELGLNAIAHLATHD